MPKQLLKDLLSEMKSRCISDIFEIQGHSYELRLLNGEESDWRNDHISMKGISLSSGGKTSVSMGVINAIKRPTLAIAIKKIDDESVSSLFEEEWDKLSEDTQLEMLAESDRARDWFVAEHILKFTGELTGDVIEALWKSYDSLTERRDKAQEELKKSSGESKTDEDSTKLSPSGEK